MLCVFIGQIVSWGSPEELWEGRNEQLYMSRMALFPITVLKTPSLCRSVSQATINIQVMTL